MCLLSNIRSEKNLEVLRDFSKKANINTNTITYNVTMNFNEIFNQDYNNLTSNASMSFISDYKKFVSI